MNFKKSIFFVLAVTSKLIWADLIATEAPVPAIDPLTSPSWGNDYVCPGWKKEGGFMYQSANLKDGNYMYFTEKLVYGYQIKINLGGTPKPNQVVKYAYIDTVTGKHIQDGTAINNQISIDDLVTVANLTTPDDVWDKSLCHGCNYNTVSDLRNRKLLIWGINYKGYAISMDVKLNLKLDNIQLHKSPEFGGMAGFTGNYSYGYTTNSQLGLSIKQTNDDQFNQAGCMAYFYGSFTAYFKNWIQGNMHPKLIITVTGSLPYNLSNFVNYVNGYDTQSKSFKLEYYKVTEQPK